MPIIDAQLHEPAVSLEWEEADDATRRLVLTELQVGYLRAVGVDRAVLFPIDLGWAKEAAALFPDRFGIVPMLTAGGAFGGIDAAAPNLDELIAEQLAHPAVVGLRVLRTMPSPDHGSHNVAPLELFDRGLVACARAGVPVFLSTAGDLETPAVIARRYEGLTLVVDHLGLRQPPTYTRDSPPFKLLPELLELAHIPNVALKVSAVPTLSEGGYPFADLWPHLHRVVDAFGPERLMWGSDISRVYGRAGFKTRIGGGEAAYAGKHTYAEALFYLRETGELSDGEKAQILGGTAERLLRWSGGL